MFMGGLSDEDIVETLSLTLTEMYISGQKSLEWMRSEQERHEITLKELYEALDPRSKGSD